MGSDRNRRRLEKIESALTPREVFASWIEEFAKFRSVEDYVQWVSQDENRRPLEKMFAQLENGITEHPNGRCKNSADKNRGELRRKKLAVQFLARLIVNLNMTVCDFLSREERLWSVYNAIQAVDQSVLSAGLMLLLRKGLAEDCLLRKDRKRWPALKERLTQMKLLLSWEVSKFEFGLETSSRVLIKG